MHMNAFNTIPKTAAAAAKQEPETEPGSPPGTAANLTRPPLGSSWHSRISSWSSAASQGIRPVGLLDLPQWGSTRNSFSSSVVGGGADRSRQSSQTTNSLSTGHGSIPEHGADKTLHQDHIFHAAAILSDSPASCLVNLPEEDELQSTAPTINITLMPPQLVLDQLSNNENPQLWRFTPASIRTGHASSTGPMPVSQ